VAGGRRQKVFYSEGDWDSSCRESHQNFYFVGVLNPCSMKIAARDRGPFSSCPLPPAFGDKKAGYPLSV